MLRIGQIETTALDGKYTDGNVAGGLAPTRLRAAAFNAMQEELCKIVESAGLSLNKDDSTQVLSALGKLFLAKIDVATPSQMQAGTATNLVPSVAAVMSLFSKRSYNDNDYIRIPDVPGGLVIQWGAVLSNSAGFAPWTFPVAFSSSCFQIYATPFVGSGTVDFSVTSVGAPSATSTTSVCYVNGTQSSTAGQVGVRYFAIGK